MAFRRSSFVIQFCIHHTEGASMIPIVVMDFQRYDFDEAIWFE